MKSIMLVPIAFALIAAGHPPPHQFATWDQCMVAASAEDDPTDQWDYVCVPNGVGGFVIDWVNVHWSKARGGRKA